MRLQDTEFQYLDQYLFHFFQDNIITPNGLILLSLYSVSNTVFSQYSQELFLKSVEEFNKGNSKVADSLITISINYDRNNFKKDYLKYYNRGIFREDMDSIITAIKDFDTSYQLKNDFYPTLENRAICHFLWGNVNQADKDMDEGLKIKPEHLEAYIFSAMINLDLKNYTKVLVACSKGLAIKKDPRFYGYKALCNLKLNKLDYAKKELELGEHYFGLNDENLMQARLYYLYLNKDVKFCELAKTYHIIFNDSNFIELHDTEFEKKFDDCIK